MSKTSITCPKCGMTFSGEKPWHNESVLRHLYHDEKLSLKETSEVFEITEASLLYWMDKHEIDRRTVSQAHGLTPLKMSTSPKGYERFTVGTTGNSTRTIHVHRLVAVAMSGADAVKGKQIHHKNGIPWDNRPENLEIMTEEEHKRMHGCERSEELTKMAREENAKLTEPEVKSIKRSLETDSAQSEIAQAHGVSQNTISKIYLEKTWADVSVK